jgi:hypothetical protein
MASIRLSWHEAHEGDLPMVCATCGDDATEMVEWKMTNFSPRIFVNIWKRSTVLMPCCPSHRTQSWNAFLRVKARSMDQHGITLGQVSADFVDAVEDYRENPERWRRRSRSSDVRIVGDEGEDVDGLPPRRRRSSNAGRYIYATLMMVGFAVVISCCGFGFLFFNLWKSGAPGFGPKRPGVEAPAGPGGPLGPPNVPRRPNGP